MMIKNNELMELKKKLKLEEAKLNNESNYENRTYKRGGTYWCDLGKRQGSIQSGRRPVLIIQNDIGNQNSPTVIVAILSSELWKVKLPTHAIIKKEECVGGSGLKVDSFVGLEQITTINKFQLGSYIGRISDDIMTNRIDKSLSISIGLSENKYITEVKRMVKILEDLDRFIEKWINKGESIEKIIEDVNDRKSRIKYLKGYCDTYNINMKEYYNEDVIHKTKNIKEMVG